MTKCTGLLGWIFGHKYIFIQIYKMDEVTCDEEFYAGGKIRCKRCGAKCDE